MQQWLLMNKKADFKAIGEKFQIDQVTARIIRNRELIEEEQIRRFLSGGIQDLYDPHLLKDGEKLVEILTEKIEKQKAIRIIGDYDIDGVMATYVLKTALDRCKANVSIQIPEHLRNKDKKVQRMYQILCVYNGKSVLLDVEFNVKTNMLSFETNKFTTFALIYTDVPVEKK